MSEQSILALLLSELRAQTKLINAQTNLIKAQTLLLSEQSLVFKDLTATLNRVEIKLDGVATQAQADVHAAASTAANQRMLVLLQEIRDFLVVVPGAPASIEINLGTPIPI